MHKLSIYDGQYNFNYDAQGVQSYLTLKNYSGVTAKIYKAQNSSLIEIFSLDPLGEIYPYQVNFKAGESLVIEIGETKYSLVAPTRAQIYLTPYGLLTNNQDPQSFVVGEKVWNSDWGYGLINVAASLEISGTPKQLANLDGANNFAALQAIRAPDAWQAGYTGKGVTVAVIDFGVAEHAKFAANLTKGYDFIDRDNDPTPTPGYAHGTGVASIVAANHTPPQSGPDVWGVAPDAKILNMRAGATLESTAEAIRWAADNQANVCVIPLNGDWSLLNKAFVDAVQYAFDKNVVVVIIGGNYSKYGGSAFSLAARFTQAKIGTSASA